MVRVQRDKQSALATGSRRWVTARSNPLIQRAHVAICGRAQPTPRGCYLLDHSTFGIEAVWPPFRFASNRSASPRVLGASLASSQCRGCSKRPSSRARILLRRPARRADTLASLLANPAWARGSYQSDPDVQVSPTVALGGVAAFHPTDGSAGPTTGVTGQAAGGEAGRLVGCLGNTPAKKSTLYPFR